MLIIPPSKYPRKHGRVIDPAGATPPTPPAALTLVAASYVSGTSVTLEFDRAIDVSGFSGVEIFVDDAVDTGLTYIADGGLTVDSPTTITLGLNYDTGSSGSELTLTAPATTGIVAVDDGAAWSGVTNLDLPFS